MMTLPLRPPLCPPLCLPPRLRLGSPPARPHTRANRPLLLALLFALGSTPARAEDPMSAAEFEAYTTGRSLVFGFEGQAYGGEDYLPGRRVRWSFLDGRCQDGSWYQEGDAICFDYQGQDGPVCWHFFATPGGLSADLLNAEPPQILYEIGEADEPLLCFGPEVGA